MTALTPVLPWLDATRRPTEIGKASMIVGGTHLLPEFWSRAAAAEGAGRLSIAVPFVEPDVFELPFFSCSRLPCFDLVLVTRPATATSSAVRDLAQLPWRSCEIRSVPDLHAKVYVLEAGDGRTCALIGSHNLTGAAAVRNVEAGLLAAGGTVTADALIASCLAFIGDLRGRARLVHDSLQWPAGLATR